MRRLTVVMTFAALAAAAVAAPAEARQLGALISPGRLSQPHASLEGIQNCEKCHEAGARVTGAKCLSCHQPIADRIRARRGVHRAVSSGDCVTCHAEHQGATGELRPFDLSQFDHRRDAGYPLDGRHAPLAASCASCHKQRSYLRASTACASCHQDTHKGTLGQNCQTCHTTSTPFKNGRQGFNHATAAFALDGAHATVACESCHRNQQYKGVAFSTCASCHRDPHTPKATAACTTCHATASWRSRRFDHRTTAFALVGKHETTACVACHVKPPLQATPRHDTCAACHTDPHKGAFAQDCKACHDEKGFAKAPFDHTATPFPLNGKHAPAACTACHTNLTRVAQRTARPTVPVTVDFGGLSRACGSCHDDVHASDLGSSCETCHTTERFAVGTYVHRGTAGFFAGGHAQATCLSCHARSGAATMPVLQQARTESAAAPAPARATNRATPVHGVLAATTFTTTARACASCHADVHLGQLNASCDTCHAVERPGFAVPATFNHATTRFPLGGKHAAVTCQRCHTSQTGAFPSGTGTAVRFSPIATTCVTCHTDVHAGQLGTACESCHTDETFTRPTYTHRNPAQRRFFVGAHTTAACSACHTVGPPPAAGGSATAVRYTIPTTCTNCHRDVHNGALGSACADCHRPDRDARPVALGHRRRAGRNGR